MQMCGKLIIIVILIMNGCVMLVIGCNIIGCRNMELMWQGMFGYSCVIWKICL